MPGRLQRKRRQAHKKSVTAKVKTIEKKINTLQAQVERKRWDIQSAPNTFGWNGSVYPLSEIPVGTNDYSREGSDCYASSIHIQGALQMNTNTIATTCRVLLVNLRYPRGGNITWTELAQDAVGGVVPTQIGTNLAPHFHKNFGTKVGFDILWDKKFELNETASNSKIFEIRRPIKKKLHFNEDTNTSEKNKLYLMVISDENGPLEPLLAFTSRLYFQG